MSTKPSTLIVLIGVLVVLGLILVVSIVGLPSVAQVRREVPPPAIAFVPPEPAQLPDAEVAISIAAEQLSRDFILNPRAALRKYQGKQIIVAGQVADIGVHDQRRAIQLVGCGASVVTCRGTPFRLDFGDPIDLEVGMRLTIEGRCVGGDDLSVSLFDAEPLMNRAFDVPAPEAAEPLTKDQLPPSEAESAKAVEALAAMGIKLEQQLGDYEVVLDLTQLADDGALRPDALALLERVRRLVRVEFRGEWTDATLQSIARLRYLESLSIERHRCSADGFAALARAPGLTSISLGRSGVPHPFNDQCLASLKGLVNLEWLRISDCDITDAGLELCANMASIASLNVGKTQITGAGLERLKHLPLTQVDLSGCPVSPAGLEAAALLPKIVSLNLRGCNLPDDSLKPFASSNIKGLDLSGTTIGDEDLKMLGNTSQLTRLDLSGTKISDKGLTHLQQVERLDTLCLNNCPNITDASLDYLERLRVVTLARTSVTDMGRERLKKPAPPVDDDLLRPPAPGPFGVGRRAR